MKVMRSDAAMRGELEAEGWRVVARSWGAELLADGIDVDCLDALIRRVEGICVISELNADNVDAVLALDAATLADYPGGIANEHVPLSAEQAAPTPGRRAWGAFTSAGNLVAMTFVVPDIDRTETDFTVVAQGWRGRGLGAAVKAASVVSLCTEGYSRFRTGGSAENRASLVANLSLGYVIDEEWVTLAPPDANG